MRLTRLAASSVRGIPKGYPAWEIGEGGIGVQGPNGVGKSSLVDAVEMLLCGITTFFPESRSGVSWEKGGTHVRGGPQEIHVDLNHKGTIHTVSLGAPREALPGPVQDWMALALRSTFVLRRHMLLRFITCEPRARYEQLQGFLNLDPYLAVETKLREWAAREQSAAALADQQAIALTMRLRTICGLSLDTAPSADALLAALNAKLATAGLGKCEGLNDASARLPELEAALAAGRATDRLKALTALRGQLERVGTAAALAPQLSALHGATVELERELAGRTQEVLTELLVFGKKVIDSHGLDTCPLCESRIQHDKVLCRLTERIATDERLTEARRLVDARAKAVLAVVRPLQQAWSDLLQCWPKIIRDPLPPTYPDTLAALDGLINGLEEGQLAGAAIEATTTRLSATPQSHDDLLHALDILIDLEDDGGKRLALEGAKSIAAAATVDGSALREAERRAAAAHKAHTFLARLHDHAVEARKKAVQRIFDNVSDIANAMYADIHPGEIVGSSRLPVRDAAKQSINLVAQFDGTDEPPMLHYSESHLDTLGLCYFLALRKHEAAKNPQFRLLVLDDVLHSVDADHRGRIVTLLRREFADHQLIITTHDEAFFKRLGEAYAGKVKLHKITNWDIDDGPYLAALSPTDLARLLDPEVCKRMDHQDLGGTCGRFFERILKTLLQRLNLKIPAKFDSELTIGELWPSLFSALRKQPGFVAAHPNLADELDANRWIRNRCGPHDTDMASPPTPAEVRELARLLAALYRVTHCDQCGTYISKTDSEDWACDCGCVRFDRKKRATAAA